MTRMQDPTYLRHQQYCTADNLNARIRLHAEFSTNPYGWFPWVFDHYDLPEDCRVLELACGPGDLWRENAARIPPGWDITLSDFSPGMVDQARENLAGDSHPYTYAVIDAQAIPFKENRFEVVIANHCLYHLPQRDQAFSEVRRVLVPGGQFYATTIGTNHLREIRELVGRFDPAIEHVFSNDTVSFTLENGAAQLEPWFSGVACRRYPDSLKVTEVEPLVDYVLSGIRFGMDASQRAAFTLFVEAEITAAQDGFHIHKDSGIFTASVLKID